MKILGVDLAHGVDAPDERFALVALGGGGRVQSTHDVAGLAEVVAAVGKEAGSDPFVLAVNLPVVVPSKAGRGRKVERLLRRRLGFRLPASGRAALSQPRGVAGGSLLAGLATAGLPCLAYPDRDQRQAGLAEIYPGLVLKSLLWETSSVVWSGAAAREEVFRAFRHAPYRRAHGPKRSTWADRAVSLDLVLRALRGIDGFDGETVREALSIADSDVAVEHAGSLLDAALIAGAARRYLRSPETCLFVGSREDGYTILPADGFVRRLAIRDARPQRTELFPRDSLKKRLGRHAELRALDLLGVEGKPRRFEARFHTSPVYEFDNVDEMLWWKHCRHLSGPQIPTEGLLELHVELGDGAKGKKPLRLTRSRHRTLSFRFDPPADWRPLISTRDGNTYPFQVLQAVYETQQ